MNDSTISMLCQLATLIIIIVLLCKKPLKVTEQVIVTKEVTPKAPLTELEIQMIERLMAEHKEIVTKLADNFHTRQLAELHENKDISYDSSPAVPESIQDYSRRYLQFD